MRKISARQRTSGRPTIARDSCWLAGPVTNAGNELARGTRASAQKEIDEPAGEFLLGAAHPRELAAQLGRHGQILAVLSRRSAMLVRAGDGRSAGPTQASGLSPRDRSH